MTKTHAMMTKDGLSASVFKGNSGFNEIIHTRITDAGPLIK